MDFDPNDRPEFAKRLDSIFSSAYPISQEELLAALSGDPSALTSVQQKQANKQSQVNLYLEQYDAAQTTEEKSAVIGSVTRPS